MNNRENFNYYKIKPFKWFVLENFPFIEYDFDALTNWQLFCKLGKEINKILASQNLVGEQVETLTNAFNNLQTFVTNYFENLDIQEEINDKLDEMAEDGTLEEIISSYISDKIIRTYDKNSSLISDESLQKNMFVRTLGKLEKNDGGGCIYKITDTQPETLPVATNNEILDNFYLSLDNNLFAIPINNINNDYYEEITFVKERHNETDCYITTIPLNDNDGNEIDLYVKNNSSMEISDYARKHKTTLSINATLTVKNPETNLHENASVISDGQIIREHFNPPDFLEDHYKFVGIKSNREFVDFQANITTAEQMVAQGVKQAWLCFGQLINNGIITEYALDENDEIMANKYPRQTIGVKLDKTVIIITCDGRSINDRGMTGPEIAQLLIENGCVNAWNLDGGGSTNTVYKGTRLNKFIDDHGLRERHIVYCLNAKKPTTNENIDNTNSFIGEIKDLTVKELLPQIPRMLVKNPANLNEITATSNIYTCYNASNIPTGASQTGYLIVLPASSENNTSLNRYCKQLYFNRDNKYMWERTLNNGVWSEWLPLNRIYNGEILVGGDQSLGIGSNYVTMQLNSDIQLYFPSTLSIDENNKITSSQPCSILVQAIFSIESEMDGDCTIRIYKNGTNVAGQQFTLTPGKRQNIAFQKALSLSANDYIEFKTNGGTNTGGVNRLKAGNIHILQQF